ncbi:T9SS type A sorting domain-containing protein [Rhodohalobacter halophilus]|uniref:T9SS type A sorting domain-containing protein n=1 Tax=Rhodohalobacter halophilus TaxID=1812810 RepID=UPI00083F94C3|nr:T9SS type A sorting domain-containing protein [Rhodohalobacter halophilus]
MGKPLQKGFFTVLLLFAVFSYSIVPGVFAQVTLENEGGIEVSFSEISSQSQSGFIQLTPEDVSRLYYNGDISSIPVWESNRSSNTPFLAKNESGDFAIGGLKPEGSPEDRLFYLLLDNDLKEGVQSFQVVFDLLYLSDYAGEYSLQLRYSLNGKDWKNVSGAKIDQTMLRGGEETWSTFSIQTTLNDLLLNPGESIEFDWVDTRGAVSADDIPVAIQSMEFIPELFTPSGLSRGDVIISEILPATESRSGMLEFIELYNPTEYPVLLKGLEVRTPAGSEVIRRDISIQPKQFTVLAHGDLSANNPDRRAVYQFSRSILPTNSGYVEIYQGGQELAKATFERSDPARSLELNSISNGFDGYTSLQHFQPSDTRYDGQISATPGTKGLTQRLFVRDLNEAGWHLLAAPGLIDERLSRLNSREFYSIGEENKPITELSVSEPFFANIEANKKVYASESTQNITAQSFVIPGTSSKIITLGTGESRLLSEIGDETGRRISPAYLKWNSSLQNFELLFEQDTEVSPWSPLIVHDQVSNPASRSQASLSGNSLNRYIQFELFESSQGNQRRSVDKTVLGFLREERGMAEARYDLPKLLLMKDAQFRAEELNLIYISSAESVNRANSFSHLPLEPTQNYSVNLGVVSGNRSYQAVLDWSAMQDIPEEWEVTLLDNSNGREIDMREQSSYEFRVVSSRHPMVEQEQEPGTIQPFSPEEQERFTITVKPFESSITQNREHAPSGNVELRQNYPNPFNPSTNVVFYLPEQQPVKVGVYNIVGQQVALLADDNFSQGEHSISWNASEMPSGVYIVQLEVGSRVFTRKITLIK